MTAVELLKLLSHKTPQELEAIQLPEGHWQQALQEVLCGQDAEAEKKDQKIRDMLADLENQGALQSLRGNLEPIKMPMSFEIEVEQSLSYHPSGIYCHAFTSGQESCHEEESALLHVQKRMRRIVDNMTNTFEQTGLRHGLTLPEVQRAVVHHLNK